MLQSVLTNYDKVVCVLIMEPVAHSSVIRQFARFAETTGISLEACLDQELTDIFALSQKAERVPARGIVDTLQFCGAALDRPDFGATFANWCSVTGYGPLSWLMEQCDSVADVVEAMVRFMHLENGALATHIDEDEEEAAVRCVVMVTSKMGSSQFIEGVLMVLVRAIRGMLGDHWSPMRIEFAHAPPADVRAHRRLFRATLKFDADWNAIVITPRDMRRSAQSVDIERRCQLEAELTALDASWGRETGDLVERATAALLQSGNARLEAVAHSLAIGPRTLQRRLADERRTFGDVLDEVRKREALDYLRGTPHASLSELAHRLGYGEASAASRFLRTKLGLALRTASKHDLLPVVR